MDGCLIAPELELLDDGSTAPELVDKGSIAPELEPELVPFYGGFPAQITSNNSINSAVNKIMTAMFQEPY